MARPFRDYRDRLLTPTGSRTPSPERREGGERQQLAKRKREEDEEDEET